MGNTKEISIGQSAPDFTLHNQNKETVTLSKLDGKWIVIFFYPKDDTPGCTVEVCSFRDNISDIKALNTIVLGVSVDNTESHLAFAENHQLPFSLLADPNGKVAELYGTFRDLFFYKKARRHSFIINPQGKIAKIYRSVNPKKHVAEVLNELRKFQK